MSVPQLDPRWVAYVNRCCHKADTIGGPHVRNKPHAVVIAAPTPARSRGGSGGGSGAVVQYVLLGNAAGAAYYTASHNPLKAGDAVDVTAAPSALAKGDLTCYILNEAERRSDGTYSGHALDLTDDNVVGGTASRLIGTAADGNPVYAVDIVPIGCAPPASP